jgi:hypothetical protein
MRERYVRLGMPIESTVKWPILLLTADQNKQIKENVEKPDSST